ncbi:zf-TFIIB domain-containing protein [Pseudocolwellia sp. HL-MZ19]|uniref:zf-TFIIB domain-containing protein n=1 Tax=unclassified Pseudocolwellia TaxID=2848178 RepID=UPI003CF6F4A4
MANSQCSSCNHIVKATIRHCPMCNGSMKSIQKSKTKSCPRCTVKLDEYIYRNQELDKCNSCEGIWLQPDEFNVLTSEFDVYRDDNSNPLYMRPGLPASENYLPCPNCTKMMSRRNFKSISGVLIDSCINCGIWLDKSELAFIRSFVASGGLDKAQDNKLVRHELQMEALDDRISEVELMQKMLNKYSAKRIFFNGF